MQGPCGDTWSEHCDWFPLLLFSFFACRCSEWNQNGSSPASRGQTLILLVLPRPWGIYIGSCCSDWRCQQRSKSPGQDRFSRRAHILPWAPIPRPCHRNCLTGIFIISLVTTRHPRFISLEEWILSILHTGGGEDRVYIQQFDQIWSSGEPRPRAR